MERQKIAGTWQAWRDIGKNEMFQAYPPISGGVSTHRYSQSAIIEVYANKSPAAGLEGIREPLGLAVSDSVIILLIF